MSVICYTPVICLVLGGVVRVRMLFIAHLCNHILLQSGGGTWAQLCTLRGEGSGSRDVEAWCANDCTPMIGGSKY